MYAIKCLFTVLRKVFFDAMFFSNSLLSPFSSPLSPLPLCLCTSGWNGAHFATQTGLECATILLPEPTKCWNYKRAPPHLAFLPTITLDALTFPQHMPSKILFSCRAPGLEMGVVREAQGVYVIFTFHSS